MRVVAVLLALWPAIRHAEAEPLSVRPQRPRIWLTPETLTRLRQSAAGGSTHWQALKNVCDSYMTSTSSYDVNIVNYALAYQITKDPRYGDKAIALAQAKVDLGMDALFVMNRHGYDTRTVLPEVSIAYDWCYDRLSPEQRAQFQAQLEAWADWVWPETNPTRSTGWAVDNPGDNHYHGFMMTWFVGLALYGDSAKAPGYVDLARRKFLERVRPYLETFSAGGYQLEGTNYGDASVFRIFWYLTAHATGTGEDLLRAPGFDWPRQATIAKLYLTTPERKRLFPGGDQPRDETTFLSDSARSQPLVALSWTEPTTARYAKWWLDNITPSRNVWRWTQWEEMLWYREDISAVDYRAVLAPGYLASGAGWMTSRSDWGPEATYVTMTCGPTRESHQDLAQNGFMIYRGDWLAAAARLQGGGGVLRQTQYHNTLMIGGRGQPEGREGLTKQLPRVLHFADMERYAYFAGEAKDAYTYWLWPSAVEVLKEFRRELLFLKPNRVVVFDRVEAVDATQVKKWHLNLLAEPTARADSYEMTLGGSKLFGKTLLPAGGLVEKVPISQGPGGALSSWRIDISAPVGRARDHFLNILETAPASQAAPTPVTAVQTGRDSLFGAQIGNQVVVFDAATAPSTSVAYQTGPTSALEHFVLDQAPGKWYQVSVQAVSGGAVTEQRVQATDQGVLVFPVAAAGAQRVTIRPLESTGGTTPAPGSTGGSSQPAPVPPAPPVVTSPPPPPPPVVIYDDALQGGFVPASYKAVRVAFAATEYRHAGDHALRFRLYNQGWLQMLHPTGVAAAGQSALRFWIHGGPLAGQTFTLRARVASQWRPPVTLEQYLPGGARAEAWTQVTVPLADLGAAGGLLTGLEFGAPVGQELVYIDDVALVRTGSTGGGQTAGPPPPPPSNATAQGTTRAPAPSPRPVQNQIAITVERQGPRTSMLEMVARVTVGGRPVEGVVVSYEICAGSILLATRTRTTDASGSATLLYRPPGNGTFTVKVTATPPGAAPLSGRATFTLP